MPLTVNNNSINIIGELSMFNTKPNNQKAVIPVDNFADREEIINELKKLIKNNYEGIVSIIDKKIFNTLGRHDINGLTAEDILNNTALKFLEPQKNKPGKYARNWNKQKYPNFEKYFIQCCFSVLNNEFKKYFDSIRQYGGKNKNVKSREVYELENDNNLIHNEHEIDLENEYEETNENIQYDINYDEEYFDNNGDEEYYRFNSETYYLDKIAYNEYVRRYNREYDEDDAEKFLEEVKVKIIKDPKAIKVYERILDGERRDRILARELNMSIKDVRNCKKKIKRAVEKISKEFRNGRKIS